jgi:hypothetical protein
VKKSNALSFALLLVGSATGLLADSATGTLFYTTFSGGVDVHKVNYNYDGISTFLLSGITDVATTVGADGILFAPDGNLLVAGQGNNHVTEVTTAGAIVGSPVDAGTGSYHLALQSNANNALLYNMWNGSGSGGSTSISALQLSGGGLSAAGIAYTVSCSTGCSTDVRGVIWDPINSKWYYGTAPDGGSGDFGTVVFNDVSHTATLTRLQTGLWAHGLSFDPFTGDVIVNSGNTIQQLNAAGAVLSTATGPGSFDQAAEDGNGHMFVASNSGNLEFIDYRATGLIGAGANFTAAPFLAGSLDDIAPLSGAGSPVPEPASVVLLGTIAALVSYRLRRKLA